VAGGSVDRFGKVNPGAACILSSPLGPWLHNCLLGHCPRLFGFSADSRETRVVNTRLQIFIRASSMMVSSLLETVTQFDLSDETNLLNVISLWLITNATVNRMCLWSKDWSRGFQPSYEISFY
jgi:hypothetical protein